MIARLTRQNSAARMAAAVLGLMLPFGATATLAQAPDRPPLRGMVGTDEKAQRQQELEALQAEQKKAATTQAKLKAEIEALSVDRRKLNLELIDTATRLRALEAKVANAEARLKTLDANEQAIRKSLSNRRAVIIEVLAALQRMGRHPPPAIMARPEDALQSVHSAMMLGAVLPEMRLETEALAADLGELVKVRAEIATERDQLSKDVAALSTDRTRMGMLIDERQRKQADTEKALEAERTRAGLLAKQADSLKELLAKLDPDAASRFAGAPPGGNLSTSRDPGRLAPAVAFVATKGHVPMPVNGVKVRDFGDPDGVGGNEKGLSVAVRAGAQVTAPCDGWVVFAGPFRSYGQLLILNAGGGYHVLLAGMDRISVDLGQFVLAGEPVAVMGGGAQWAAAVAIGSSQPILYVEFRKDGTPVDPGPWWAVTDSEKVRG
jgi:septal ring factor EnvC (AmiA/AmiB activator)